MELPNYIKFYEKEAEIFSKYRKLKVSNADARKICRKLEKHFKFILREIRFKRGTWSYAYLELYTVVLTDNPSIDIIAHELAHIYRYCKYGKERKTHTKKLMNTIKRFIRYMEKKNFWDMIQCTES